MSSSKKGINQPITRSLESSPNSSSFYRILQKETKNSQHQRKYEHHRHLKAQQNLG